MSSHLPFASRDNEFIAWYPNALAPGSDRAVWTRKEAAFYIHIPFCDQICDYCGFAVQQAKTGDRSKYLAALENEIRIEERRHFLATKRFTVGHFGGGTPSVLDPSEMERILRVVADVVDLSEMVELTVEANPISLTFEKASSYRGLGINRLSIGIQSFNSQLLQAIGRPHRRHESIDAYEIARKAGFDNVSVDLMYSLPGQTLDDLRKDLDQVAALGPDHISCFALEPIPMTPLAFKRHLGLLDGPLPDKARQLEMHALVFSSLVESGYSHYGAMNFARNGKVSEHNRIAFMAPQGEYIGWGNSAYSFINDHVFCNVADIGDYVAAIEGKQPAVAFVKKANVHELASRFLVLGLKFLHVRHRDFAELFGKSIESYFSSQLEALSAAGYIQVDEQGVFLTELGILYVNNVCKEFYVGENVGRSQYVQFSPTISAKRINALFDSAASI